MEDKKKIEKIDFSYCIVGSNDAFTNETSVAIRKIKDKLNEIIEQLNNIKYGN